LLNIKVVEPELNLEPVRIVCNSSGSVKMTRLPATMYICSSSAAFFQNKKGKVSSLNKKTVLFFTIGYKIPVYMMKDDDQSFFMSVLQNNMLGFQLGIDKILKFLQ
jgi:hypothetical protein